MVVIGLEHGRFLVGEKPWHDDKACGVQFLETRLGGWMGSMLRNHLAVCMSAGRCARHVRWPGDFPTRTWPGVNEARCANFRAADIRVGELFMPPATTNVRCRT